MRTTCSLVLLTAMLLSQAADAPAETILLPMRDGTRLATELQLPTSGGPTFPVVLVRTLYGRNSDKFANAITSRGMAAVIQDTRGYGDSEGERLGFEADGWGKLQDGVDTIAWIKKQPWFNGKIGTWGVSALGITQNMLAPTSPDVSAQVIGLAPFSMFPVFMRGGVPQKLLPERYVKMMGHHRAFAERRNHPTYDDYWRLGDPESRVAEITAPAVLVGGWFDLYPQGMIENFVARQYRGGPGARGNQKLIIGPWEHGITEQVGDLKFPNYKFDWNALSWRFMQHWLQGTANAVMDEPAVHYYTLGDCSDPAAPGNCWRTATAWPPFPTVPTRYFLASDGALTTQPALTNDAKRSFAFDPANPCPSLGGDTATRPLPLDQRPNLARGDVLAFATEPLADPLEVTGAVSMRLFVSSDAPDTDFTAKLVDIYPDGRQISICDGIQRVKFRRGFEKPDPLAPGSVGELTIDCWSTSIIFNRGHRIGVLISSSNWPRFEVNPNTGADLPQYTTPNELGDWQIDKTSLRVAHNTVLMDAAHPSALVLPVRTVDTSSADASQQRGKVMTHDLAPQPHSSSAGRVRPPVPRITPLTPETATPAQQAVLAGLVRSGQIYNVFGTMANHPDLARDWLVFASHVLSRNSLPPRDREILILRIGWLCQSEYEWAQHVRIGKKSGLTDADIEHIRLGPTAAGISDSDRLLLQATDELHADACISEPTWQALAKIYDQNQRMDLVFTVGQYNMVSMALNSFGVQLDAGLEGFPKAPVER
jgi:hypothetical protein